MQAITYGRASWWRGAACAVECRQVAFGALLAGVSVLSCGCSAPQRLFRPDRAPDTLNDVAFVHYLATVPVVTVDEGMRSVFLLREAGAKPASFNERHAALCRLGAVKASWHLRPDQVLDKGTLAHILRELCGMPRSFNERCAGAVGVGERRYALRTCIDEGLLPYGLAHQAVSGGEMLSALTAAEQYIASRKRDTGS